MPKIWSRRTLAMPLSLTALWCLVVYVLFLWVARSEADHVRELALSQARTLFTQLVSTRAWNAMYGGVFVLESERDRPNLDLPENRRAVETSEGLRLIRVNPAYMTRQIAEIVNSRQGVTFHITSLDPVRAANAPDAWETEALQAFRDGEKEVFALCEEGEKRFRYMAPLHVDTTCWDCHYVEPRGILRPDRPQETYQLKAMGTPSSAPQDERSPLALGKVPQGDELSALVEACPEVESGADGVITTATPVIPTLRGGISVSMAAGPLLAVEAGRVRVLAMAYGGIGILGVIGIGGASLVMSRRQAVAEAANRTKGAFLANMSHDMRTPLAGMLGMVELMQNPQCTKNKCSEYLKMLQGSARSLLEIVNDITDFSRLEAGKMGLCPQTFFLREELTTVVDLFRFACEQKGLALHLHVDANVPDHLMGDAFRLRQALGNLLGNAVKFTDRGRVDVTVHVLEWRENLVVHFGVRDTGRGIAEEDHERIFESFVQSSASRQELSIQSAQAIQATQSGGSGLGLAIVRDIAGLFHGQVGVESSVGHGSFFWFTACLDLVEDTPSPTKQDCALSEIATPNPALPQQAGVSKKHFTILVADDNAVVRLFFHETLMQAGYHVLLAEHGEAALTLLREKARNGEQACHMALLDVRMPRRSGPELLASIRAGEVLGTPANVPIYMVTASALCDADELRGTVDANGVVLKPLQASTLRELVDGVYASWCTQKCKDGGACSMRKQDTESGKEALSEAPRMNEANRKKACPCHKALALEGLDNNEALFKALVTAFIPEARARRVRLVEALEVPEKSLMVLREEAHALANSAGVLCCHELYTSAKTLEKMVIAELKMPSDLDAVMLQAKAMLEAFDDVLEACQDMLDVCRDELNGPSGL